MPKKIDPKSLIYSELTDLEDKVKEFQKYLKLNPIISVVTGNTRTRIDEIDLAPEDKEELHKEIAMQIKMQDALFSWLPALEKLKEKQEESKGVRGGIEVGDMFK